MKRVMAVVLGYISENNIIGDRSKAALSISILAIIAAARYFKTLLVICKIDLAQIKSIVDQERKRRPSCRRTVSRSLNMTIMI